MKFTDRRASNPASAFDGTELIPIAQDGVSKVATVSELAAGIGGSVGVKVYRAVLTQVGTAPPIAAVLENSLGGEIVFSREELGEYKGALVGAFPDPAKVQILIGSNSQGVSTYALPSVGFFEYYTLLFNGDDLVFQTADTNNVSIQIIVYP
jgi:hypothetical protein